MACKSIITHIEAQTEQVIARYEKLEAEYASLQSERDSLQREVRAQAEQIQQLKADIKKLELTESLGGGMTDKTKSRARINLLLREVDKCIALLTKGENQ